MTRHYTHTGEAAAAAAVASLPSVMGDAPAALPPADPLATFKARVRELAESISGETWESVRGEFMKLAQ